MKLLIPHLVKQFRDLRNGHLWMGENFEVKLARLTPDQAFERPFGSLHSAAELLAHLTAWQRDALLKIREGKGRLQDRDAENWPEPETLKSRGWENILAEFDAVREELLSVLEGKDDRFLEQTYYDQDYQREYPYSFLVDGLLHHDLYHLGQLGIIIKSVTA